MPPTATLAARSMALETALAEIERNRQLRQTRKARIDADPRIVRLRSMRPALPASAAQTFAGMADGSMALRGRIVRLIDARIAMLDGFPHVAREYLRQAAVTRRQHWTVTHANAEMVTMKFGTEPSRNNVSEQGKAA